MRIWYQSFVDEENGAEYWRHLRAHLAAMAEPGTEVTVHGITPFDSYAHPIVEMRCAREVVCNAVRAEREGYDAFVIGHFQDTGLHESRTVVDIPVVSLGEATMLHGATLGMRSALITINRRFIPWHHHQIKRLGLGERVTGVHAMQFEPGQILAAFDHRDRLQVVREMFEAQAAPLVAAGAEVLIPAGGIPMLLFSAIKAHCVGDAPVINGIPIVLKHAEMAVKLRALTGLQVSRVGDYVKAPPEVIEEFMTHPKGL
ncbi:MAG: aspartate/glutamate racemase family protein [Sulfitobacter sp.]